MPAVLGLLTGHLPATGQNFSHYVNAIHDVMATIAVIFSYCFNYFYLKHKHAGFILHENANSQKNLIDFKKLILGMLVILLLISVVIGVQTLVHGENKGLLNIFLPCFSVTFLNLYFSKSKEVLAHAKVVFQQRKENVLFSSFSSVFNMCAGTNRILPNTLNLEMLDLSSV